MDSLTPLISTGVTRNHLLRLCCRVRVEAGPLSRWPGKCRDGSMELWLGAHVTGVPVKPSWHDFSHSKGLWDPPPGQMRCSMAWTQCLLLPDWGIAGWTALSRIPVMSVLAQYSGYILVLPSRSSATVLGSPFNVQRKWEGLPPGTSGTQLFRKSKTLEKVQKTVPQGTIETGWALKCCRLGLKLYFSSPWSCILCQVINLPDLCIIIFKMETYYSQYDRYPVACQVSWSVPEK